MSNRGLSNSKWGFMEGKIDKKMAGWKGNILSIGDRISLTNACLSSIPLYMMSFLEAPKESLKKMNTSRAIMVC